MVAEASAFELLNSECAWFWPVPGGDDDCRLIASIYCGLCKSDSIALEPPIGEVVLEEDGEFHVNAGWRKHVLDGLASFALIVSIAKVNS